jgi:hypothetical protein
MMRGEGKRRRRGGWWRVRRWNLCEKVWELKEKESSKLDTEMKTKIMMTMKMSDFKDEDEK